MCLLARAEPEQTEAAYRWAAQCTSMAPLTVSDMSKKTAAASRSFAPTKRTTRKAMVAYDNRNRLRTQRTGVEPRECFLENHSNAQYQSKITPPAAQHTTSHQGCLACTVSRFTDHRPFSSWHSCPPSLRGGFRHRREPNLSRASSILCLCNTYKNFLLSHYKELPGGVLRNQHWDAPFPLSLDR